MPAQAALWAQELAVWQCLPAVVRLKPQRGLQVRHPQEQRQAVRAQVARQEPFQAQPVLLRQLLNLSQQEQRRV